MNPSYMPEFVKAFDADVSGRAYADITAITMDSQTVREDRWPDPHARTG